jgi:hypothetical protein
MFKPPVNVAKEAQKAIDLKKLGHDWGTPVGWKRASQLAKREPVSLDIIKRMVSYFARHEVDKKGKNWSNKEKPSKGKLAWLGWGGDAGRAWANKILKQANSTETAALIEDVSETKLLYQKDMIELLKSSSKELKKYQKIGSAYLRQGAVNEKIKTVIDGKLETISFFSKHSGAVVKGPKGEEYIISADKLDRYIIDKPLTQEYQKYKVAKAYVWAIKCRTPLVFMAKWNQKMVAEKGDWLCSPDQTISEVYRIEKSIFSKTYKKV